MNSPTKSTRFFYTLVYLAWSLPALAALAAPGWIAWKKYRDGLEHIPFRLELTMRAELIEGSLLLAASLGVLILIANARRLGNPRGLFPDSALLWRWIAPTVFFAYALYFLIIFQYGPLIILTGFAAFYAYGLRKLAADQMRQATLWLAMLGLLPPAIVFIIKIV